MKEIWNGFIDWLVSSNDTNGNVMITAVSVMIVAVIAAFMVKPLKENSQRTKSQKEVRSVEIPEVFTFNVESKKSNSGDRLVTLRIKNSSNQNRKFELKTVLKDAGDPKNPMIRAIDGEVSNILEIPANDGESVEIGKLISARGGPGRAICEFEVKPLDWGNPYKDEKEVRHV